MTLRGVPLSCALRDLLPRGKDSLVHSEGRARARAVPVDGVHRMSVVMAVGMAVWACGGFSMFFAQAVKRVPLLLR